MMKRMMFLALLALALFGQLVAASNDWCKETEAACAQNCAKIVDKQNIKPQFTCGGESADAEQSGKCVCVDEAGNTVASLSRAASFILNQSNAK